MIITRFEIARFVFALELGRFVVVVVYALLLLLYVHKLGERLAETVAAAGG